MPRINPTRLTEVLEKILAEVEEAYELSKNNDLTDILERVRGRITILIFTISSLLPEVSLDNTLQPSPPPES